MPVGHADLVTALEEVIAALDRRIPHLERAGEAAIVREAASLRAQAMRRLRELDPHTSTARRVPDDTEAEG